MLEPLADARVAGEVTGDFVDGMRSAFARAAASRGIVEGRIRVAGRSVRLEFAGAALTACVMPALEHLAASPGPRTELTIRLMDSVSTGVSPPQAPWSSDSYLARGDVLHDLGAGWHVWFSTVSGILNLYDRRTRTAFAWLRDPACVPAWELAAPLRSIFGWWADGLGMQLAHGAAVGRGTKGALLTGPGGLGKSTLSLACLEAGMHYAGDDYVLVGSDPRPTVHSLYSSAKLERTQLGASFPALRRLAVAQRTEQDDKATLLLYPSHRPQMVEDLDLVAIVVPKRSGSREARVRSASPIEVLTALAPSSLFLVPGAGRSAFDALGRLARRLPGYVLDLGPDTAANVAAIEGLLA